MFKGEYALHMFSQEVISTDKFSVNHFLHNEVKNTDISSCIAHLARGLQPMVPFAEGVGGGFEASDDLVVAG